jgi:UDP-N-acetyl-D-mannosaminuronate dehydrogenase
MRSTHLSDALAAADLVCIVTAHPEIDYVEVVSEAPLVVDLRGVTRGIRAENLVRL